MNLKALRLLLNLYTSSGKSNNIKILLWAMGYFQTFIVLQETIAHKTWLKAYGLLLKLHFV